jgi:DNA-binding NtrC family response regulator
LESNVKRLITYYPDFEMEPASPADSRFESGLIQAREKLEKTMILNALGENNWNKVETAAVLKISRQYLFVLLKKYDIKRKD